MKQSILISLFLSIFLVFSSAQANSLERLFAPKAKLWTVWAEHNPASVEEINHQAWTDFLQKYVTKHEDKINRMNYPAVTDADKQLLKMYISTLSKLNIRSYSRQQQLPYWINLYNALTVDVILDHYPVSSIRKVDISPGLFKDGPWDKKLAQIQGEEVSLNDIEHRILRPIWKDPRLHYALNCASLGCPNILPVAYTAGHIDGMLDMAAEAFINHKRGVSVIDGKLVLSSIYNWFRKDFGQRDKDVLDHIRQQAHPALRLQLDDVVSIHGYQYDWSLNDTFSNAGN